MMNLIPWGERRELDLFRNEMDSLFDRFFQLRPLRRLGEGEWMPAMDISETEKDIIVHAEVPGMDAKDIDISVHGRVLTMRGERKNEKEEKDKNYHKIERRYGSFIRSFELPTEVDVNKAAASCKDGVLELKLPKSKEQATKKIEIKTH